MTSRFKVTRALVSVFDKQGIVEFAKSLDKLGVEIISTGGTAKTLAENNIHVTQVTDFTGFPEVFGGRVKTLHPKIEGGILYRRGIDENEAANNKIQPIDLVVVNLYPFEEAAKKGSFEDAVENIDVGGPTMIRAAAKNFESVAVVVSPSDYSEVITELEKNNCTTSLELRRKLMLKAFELTSDYDAKIAAYFDGKAFPNELRLSARKTGELRYGENPHQKAAVYSTGRGLAELVKLSGKELSFNNYLDADAAFSLIEEFKDENACVIIKHTNPCGGAIGESQAYALEKALATDPLSAFGGIFAFSKPLETKTAQMLADKFIEIVIAPGFDPSALEIIKQKKNCRVLDVSGLFGLKRELEYRSITGGFLAQTADDVLYEKWLCVSKRKPSASEEKAMQFGWKFLKHVKSNSIVLSNETQLLGVGAGQQSRVDSVELAIKKAGKAGLDIKGCAMASDAFFPFSDSIETAQKSGISAVVQPGGSLKDNDVIKAADDIGIAMVLTGTRHFKH